MPRLLPLRFLDRGVRALVGSYDSVSQPSRPIPPPATTAHIYSPNHNVKELYAGGHVEVLYKNTKLNFADLFTKPVTREVIKTLIRKLCGYDTDW